MQATLKIKCKNPNTIRKSLLPDIKNKKDVVINIKAEKNHIIITIKTEKITYLKAIINSYLTLIKTLKNFEG